MQPIGSAVHWECGTLGAQYFGSVVHWEYGTLGVRYIGSVVHWECGTLAVWYISETAVYVSCRDLEFQLCADIYSRDNVHCYCMTVNPQI